MIFTNVIVTGLYWSCYNEFKSETNVLLISVSLPAKPISHLPLETTKHSQYIFREDPVSSVQFSHSVMSNSLQPHALQQARLLCPPLSPGVCSNSCPLSQWCYPNISSSGALFSFCLQSFPESESFPMSQPFISGGQSIEASASAPVLSKNIQSWSFFLMNGPILGG